MSTAASARFMSRACCAAATSTPFSRTPFRCSSAVTRLCTLRRAKENHRILNLLAPEARQRLAVFREQAQNSSVGTI